MLNANEEGTEEFYDLQAELLGSFLTFTRLFYELRTGRKFIVSEPINRESHFITVAKALTKVFRGEITRLIINVPPRHGKTELLIHFVAWALAHYSDSNFLYISYAHNLAKRQTQTIRDILTLPYYRKMFDITLSDESTAKDDFVLNNGGSVYAAGAGGTITGHGAGIMGCNRFGGAIIMDDMHKPDEATSDVIRQGVIDWYYNTLQSRLNNGDKTPIIFIGQRVHEDDLPAHLLNSTEKWERVILPAIDSVGNVLYPSFQSKEMLLKMKELEPYSFAAQYQQDPQPAGGGIWKKEDFLLLEDEPNILATFITADTAETDKTYNDKTVFSFWGVYKVLQKGIETGLYGLHWLDCVELNVEPKDLESEFFQFYTNCRTYPTKPSLAAIEKKSTGVTLLSVLKSMQGLKILEIERTKASGSKTARFLEAQPYIAQKLITLPSYGKHSKMCIEHCVKITANNSHRFDDIADTLYDAIKIALIDKTIMAFTIKREANAEKNIINSFVSELRRQSQRRY